MKRDTTFHQIENNHYAIDKTGKMQEISRPETITRCKRRAYLYMQSKVIEFYDVNIGLVDERGYKVNLYIGNSDKRQESVELKGTIQGAHIIENHIYAFSQARQSIYFRNRFGHK